MVIISPGWSVSERAIGLHEGGVATARENLNRLTDLPGQWIDRMHRHRKLTRIVLQMDSSVSETYGRQQGTAFNGHFACTCYHPVFAFNQSGKDAGRSGELPRSNSAEGELHSKRELFQKRINTPF
jgi:hypothetical protein